MTAKPRTTAGLNCQNLINLEKTSYLPFVQWTYKFSEIASVVKKIAVRLLLKKVLIKEKT